MEIIRNDGVGTVEFQLSDKICRIGGDLRIGTSTVPHLLPPKEKNKLFFLWTPTRKRDILFFLEGEELRIYTGRDWLLPE